MYYLREYSLHSDTPVFQSLDPDGLFFPEKTIAYDFANTGVYERSLIDWAMTIMNPSMNFVDIGAHIGTWSLSFAKHARHVYSFECTPRTYNILCGNIALRNLDDKITAHKTALGNHNGTTTLHIRSEDGGGNTCLEGDTRGVPYETPLRTLDSFQLENIGLIKIDVEGLEQQVIEGMTETLKRNHYPRILFESWAEFREAEGVPARKLRRDLFERFESIGYTVVPIRGWNEMFIAEPTNATISE